MAVTTVLPRLKRFPKDAYKPIAPRLAGQPRLAANKRGWGSGWPNCQADKMAKFRANRISRPIRAEVADLIEFLMKASNALGYDIRKADETDGGCSTFVCRAIKHSNPPAPSNHSWGLAIDQNSRSNPMSKTWLSTTPPEVVDMWESAGWFWGGRYPAKTWFYDAMHFEYMGRPEDVAKDLESAKAAFKRLGGTTLYPELREGATNAAMVRALQHRLNVHGVDLAEDGDFGVATSTAVRTFQKSKGLVVDTIVGPKTWHELNLNPGTGDSDSVEDPAEEPEAAEPEVVEPAGPTLEEQVATLEQEKAVLLERVTQLEKDSEDLGDRNDELTSRLAQINGLSTL